MRRARAAFALPFALPFALGACGVRMTVGGGTRFEQVAATATTVERALRAEGRAVASLPVGNGAIVLDVAPSVVRPLDATATARERLRVGVALQPSPRAAVQPSATFAWEQGTTRASDLVGESFEPRPAGTFVRSARLTGDVGGRWRRNGRHAMTALLGAERNGGLGVDAAVLPMLTRASARLSSEHRRDARTSFSLIAGADRVGLAGSPTWSTVALGASWARRTTRRSSVGLDLGALAPFGGAGSGLAARFAARIHRDAAGAVPSLDLSLGQGPELDRLDGSIRLRRRAEIGSETALVSTVSIRGTLQGLFDAGASSRRTVGGQVVVKAGLGAIGEAELGVARLMLSSGSGAARGETRITAGLRLPALGHRCRSSC